METASGELVGASSADIKRLRGVLFEQGPLAAGQCNNRTRTALNFSAQWQLLACSGNSHSRGVADPELQWTRTADG
eukprot:4279656-Amphidinium_carterae.1